MQIARRVEFIFQIMMSSGLLALDVAAVLTRPAKAEFLILERTTVGSTVYLRGFPYLCLSVLIIAACLGIGMCIWIA